jgi:hypothetical protein
MAKLYYSPGGRAAVNAVLSAPTAMEAMRGMATIKGITKGIIPAGTAAVVGKSNLGKQVRQPDWSFLTGKKSYSGTPNPTPDQVTPQEQPSEDVGIDISSPEARKTANKR